MGEYQCSGFGGGKGTIKLIIFIFKEIQAESRNIRKETSLLDIGFK